MKYGIFTGLLLVGVVIVGTMAYPDRQTEPENKQPMKTSHLYVSWETREFDKCVAAWLIKRFVDPKAEFKLVPKDTVITEGTPFDVPGAAWSRQHRKCTSQCVLATMPKTDPAIEEIVTMAARIELNFWQLDHWPETQAHFHESLRLFKETEDSLACLDKMNLYLDRLYADLQKGEVVNDDG